MITLDEACAKLGALSDERAKYVLELIEDLAQLEAMENAKDLATAKAALANSDEMISLDDLEKRLGL